MEGPRGHGGRLVRGLRGICDVRSGCATRERLCLSSRSSRASQPGHLAAAPGCPQTSAVTSSPAGRTVASAKGVDVMRNTWCPASGRAACDRETAGLGRRLPLRLTGSLATYAT